MMTVFVLHLHYRGPRKNEIPVWLQQLLSFSLANVARTFRKSKRCKMVPKNKEKVRYRKHLHGNNNRDRDTKNCPSVNGILLSSTNTENTISKAQISSDVSKSIRIIFVLKE